MIREAEMKSSSQSMRIQELEVQLHEAEDTITSLRTELEKVNTELEQMKNNLAEPLIGQNTNAHGATDNENGQEDKICSDSKLYTQLGPEDTSAIDVKNSTLNQRTVDDHDRCTGNAAEADPLKDLSAENGCANNPDLASIIMRSKEPELYRNGCTQRIRAFEQNLLSLETPCGQSVDQVSMNNLKFYEDEKAKRSCAANSAISAKMVDQEKNPTKSGELKFFRRLSPRRKRSKYVCVKTTTFDASSNQDMMGHKPSDNMTESGEILFEAVNKKTAQESTESFKSSDDRKLCIGKSFENETPVLLPCSKRTAARQSVAKESHLDAEDETLKGSESSTNDIVHQEPKMGDVPTRNSDLKTENAHESSGPPVLKYTFQRKRKRGSLNSKDEKKLPEKISSSNRVVDHPSALVKPQKPSLATEAPRSNRRLVQVARQLISLSSKRW